MITEIGKAPDVVRMDLEALRNLTVEDFGREMTPAEVRHILERCGALWLHSGDPSAPHAELTGDRCSNGFVNALRMLNYTNLCRIMAEQLVLKLRHIHNGRVDWVVGSDHAAATLSFAVADALSARHDFTEKGEGKTQVWRRFEIEPEEVVLQVEDLVTTTGTLQAVRQGIRTGNPHPVKFAPLSLALVHRSDVHEFEGGMILHLVHLDVKTWPPDDCPLCRGGSERLRPKQNWARLVGRA